MHYKEWLMDPVLKKLFKPGKVPAPESILHLLPKFNTIRNFAALSDEITNVIDLDPYEQAEQYIVLGNHMADSPLLVEDAMLAFALGAHKTIGTRQVQRAMACMIKYADKINNPELRFSVYWYASSRVPNGGSLEREALAGMLKTAPALPDREMRLSAYILVADKAVPESDLEQDALVGLAKNMDDIPDISDRMALCVYILRHATLGSDLEQQAVYGIVKNVDYLLDLKQGANALWHAHLHVAPDTDLEQLVLSKFACLRTKLMEREKKLLPDLKQSFCQLMVIK